MPSSLGRYLPQFVKNKLVWCRWMLGSRKVRIEFGAEIDTRTSLGEYVGVRRRASISGTDIGRYSYIGEDCLIANTEIGSFCSIAAGVIVGGGIHPSRDWVSTAPVFYGMQESRQEACFVSRTLFDGNLRTVIGHDVWIGFGAIILPGVTLGNGVIVGAGAVVTKSVPDYQIVAGVPAKFIRDRFSADEIAWLQETQWWNWAEEKLRQLAPDFRSVEALRSRVGAQANALIPEIS
jgi:acetyltransferase-like isoleucine patch superfamily enzyme